MRNIIPDSIDRRLAFGLAGLAILIAGLLFFGAVGRSDAAKPRLMLMSSIPLQWGDANFGDVARGEARPSSLFARLSANNEISMIDDFQQLGKPGAVPLLLVQPRALAPRELVELDGWIRKGGTAIIFADPALDWPSDLPLGDQRRPLFTSLLTPMFRHWGLELALPVSAKAAPDEVAVGNYRVSPESAGIWMVSRGKPAAQCRISADQFVALCKVGGGRALLVADADLLYDDRWTGSVMASGTADWLDALIVASRQAESLPESLWQATGD